MGYCILRFAKIKSRVSLLRAAKHNTRERMPSNADPALSKRNVITESAESVMADYTAKLPPKVRKNAVHAVEVVVTLSPDAWSDQKMTMTERYRKAQEYLAGAIPWVIKTLGGQNNLLSGTVHFDEKTPHAHIIMMPLRDGKLNAKAYIGGHRDRLKELQTKFYEEVGKKFGLERGRPREQTKARHMDIKTYYAKMDQAMALDRQRDDVFRKASETRIRKIRDDGLSR